MTNKFKPGDTVQLKTGGQKMLIIDRDTKRYRAWNCVWRLTDGSLIDRSIPGEFLVGCSQEANDKCVSWLKYRKKVGEKK